MRAILTLITGAALAGPAIAETSGAPLAPLGPEPSIEARLVPAVIPDGDAFAGLDEWRPDAMRLAAILGEDGLPREAFRMAETFDDVAIDEDALLAEAEYDEM